MFQKKFVFILCLLSPIIIINLCTITTITSQSPMDMDFMNNPEFLQMLEEFERELANLSPEERQQFDDMVNEFARIIEEMPEEEFNQLLQDINNDFTMMDESGIAENAPQDNTLMPSKVTQLIIPDEIKKLADILQNIKTYLSVLLVKVQIAPEFSLKIDKWILQGKIEHIPQNYTWDQYNYDIEKFSVLVSHLLLTDKNMNPIFLFEIHKDLALEDILSNLVKELTVVPSIDIVEFGFKQEKETNIQIQQILSHIAEALFNKDIITKLDLIFKSREEEIEAKQKEAVTKGKAETEKYTFSPYAQPTGQPEYYDNFDREFGRENDEFYDLYNDYDYYDSSYPRYNYESSPSGKESKENQEKTEKSTSEKRAEPKELKPEKTKKEEKEEKNISSLEKKLQKQLDEIVLLVETANIERFEQYLKNNEIKFTLQNTLNNAEKLIKLTKDTSKTVKELLDLLDEEDKPEKIIESIQKNFDTNIKETNKFLHHISRLVMEKDLYSLEKRFGHFGDTNSLEIIKKQNPIKAKELESQQDKLISIMTLTKNLEKLSSALKPLTKKEEKKVEDVSQEKTVAPDHTVIPEKVESLPLEIPQEFQEEETSSDEKETEKITVE